MLENWAKFAGFAAILAVALAGGLTWVLPDFFPPNPAERSIAQCTQLGTQQNQKSGDNVSRTDNPTAVVSRNEAAQHNEAADQPNGNSTYKYECLVAAYTSQLATFTELLVIVTAFLIAIGLYQGAQLKRSVDVTERTNEVLERAYLWPGPGASKSFQPGRRTFVVTVHNTGKTVGIITDVYYCLSTEQEFNAGRFKLKHQPWEDVIPPEMAVGQQKGTPASVELIGQTPQILHGYILYRDVFRKKVRRCPWKHTLYPDGNSIPLPGCYTEWE